MLELAQLENTLFLAPMEGISNIAFRKTLEKIGGIDTYSTEFIRISQQTPKKSFFIKNLIPPQNSLFNVQLMGNNKELMAETARIIDQLEFVDIIDINLGCPTTRALKGNVGAAMLRDITLLREVMTNMRKNIKKSLFSAKIRCGYDTNETNKIVQTLQDIGIDFVTIHPRRAVDSYRGKANWDIIAKIKKQFPKLFIIGNGDIKTPQDTIQIQTLTNCNALMIGRAAISNPWIFQEIKYQRGLIKQKPQRDYLFYLQSMKEEFSILFNNRENQILSRMKELLRLSSRLQTTQIKENIQEILKITSAKDFYTQLENIWET